MLYYLFIGIPLAILVGFLAAGRGRSGFLWFLISLIFSPLLGAIVLYILPRK